MNVASAKKPSNEVGAFMEWEFFRTQLITYFGNKRKIVPAIMHAVDKVRSALHKDKLTMWDPFCGSTAATRALKSRAFYLYASDIESYAVTMAKCYLTNSSEYDAFELIKANGVVTRTPLIDDGIIRRLYAPKDENNITLSDRCFYTIDNARRIDTWRQAIDTVRSDLRPLLLAPLLVEASICVNTAGGFSSFFRDTHTGLGKFGGTHSDDLRRILAPIRLDTPVLSRFDCRSIVFRSDVFDMIDYVPDMDLVYLDPPYTTDTYSSRYHMLTTINDYVEPRDISPKSGIPKKTQVSDFYSKQTYKNKLLELIDALRTKYILLSYSDRAFINLDELLGLLSKYKSIDVTRIKHSTVKCRKRIVYNESTLNECLILIEKGR